MNGVVLMAGPKSVLTKFVIHYRLESREVGALQNDIIFPSSEFGIHSRLESYEG